MTKSFSAALETLDSLSSSAAVGLGVLFLVGVGLIDYGSGVNVSVAAFYAVPVILFAWKLGPVLGLAMAALCGFVQFLSNTTFIGLGGPSSLVLWNVFMDFSVSVILVAIVWALRNSLAAARIVERIDPVTGLANAKHFLECAEIEFERSRLDSIPIALAILDVSASQDVSASSSSSANPSADALKTVAEVLRNRTRNIDLSSRLDGGVFGLLLAGCDLRRGGEVLADLSGSIESALSGTSVSLLVGAVILERPARRVDEMLRHVGRMLPSVPHKGERCLLVVRFP